MSIALKSILGALGAALLLVACATTGSTEAAAPEGENVLVLGQPASAPVPAAKPGSAPINPSERQNSYRLRPRDFIRVLVINEPDTQIERRINADGTVDIPYLKQLVPVAGLTLTQAQVEIATRFREDFQDPQVAINMVTYAERRVYVSGYVGKPGPVSIPPEETLTLGRALSAAGGILPRGRRSDVAVKRIRDGNTVVITRDMRRIDSGEEPDFILEDEDQIYVEDSRI